MPVTEQGVSNDRYRVIPRTAIFLRRGDEYLLIKGAPTKRLWANKYNGIGGHIERGEDALSSAKRELLEETGLITDLWLCGILIVDTDQDIGICLYIFTGVYGAGDLRSSREGIAEWVSIDRLTEIPVVEDLPVLLQRIHLMKRGDPTFSARSFYDEGENLTVCFG